MKKIYSAPKTMIVGLKIESLLQSYSNTEAAQGATSLSRGGSWDDDEEEEQIQNTFTI